jgi:hypothetical protein
MIERGSAQHRSPTLTQKSVQAIEHRDRRETCAQISFEQLLDRTLELSPVVEAGLQEL